MEIAILVTLIVGFIITWIVCAASSSSEDDIVRPGYIYPVGNDFEKTQLKMEKEVLERRVYTLERELYYRKYDRPVPVDINLDVKVETNEQIVSVS